MLQIGDTIISFDILDKFFCCDLSKCLGECCVQGDVGAPLQIDELIELENIFQIVKKYLDLRNVITLTTNLYEEDIDGEFVTPLVEGQECAYIYYEDNIAKCAIEKAYFKGEIAFRKPISCHLYPIRITKYPSYEAVNYHDWYICKDAKLLGKSEKIPIYKFLKEPLIRKYGNEWYEQLVYAAENLKF
jgi:hypothetical protein